ncbi:Uncharacterised protein [Shigella sonnei]|nr:Uncharacterised protein [Shigella sonnei]
MYRHPCLREIVIAHRVHPHNGKHPPKSSKLLCSPNANRPMTFNIQSRQLVCIYHFFVQLRIVFQHSQIHISYQFQQRAILRNFLLVHG